MILNNILPVALIAIGSYIYYNNFGMTLAHDLNTPFLGSALLVVLGFIILLKKRV